MTIFEDLRKSVLDSSASLANVLRKAKLLASYLGNKEFREWVNHELAGYPEGANLPNYRILYAASLGHFSGPYGREVSNYVLPTLDLPPGLKDLAENIPLAKGIKEIESMAKSEKEVFRAWPAEAVIEAREKIHLTGGFVLVEARQPLTRAALEGVLDAVRNRLLDFLLELQELDPAVIKSEEALPKLGKEKVSQVFNITIHGSHNVLAGGTSVSQTVNQKVSPPIMDGPTRR